MVNFYFVSQQALLLYFKCSQGHYTPCKTGMQIFYCPQCKKMFNKKDCERYSDRPSTKVYKRGTRIPFLHNKTLYKFTDSVRRNYRKKNRVKKIISSWLL